MILMSPRDLSKAILACYSICLLLVGNAMAQNQSSSGSQFGATLTFVNQHCAALLFNIPPLLIDPNNPPVTTLLVEFGKDNSAGTTDPGLSNSVTFRLNQGRLIVLPQLSLDALPRQVIAHNNTKQISMSRPRPAEMPGLYKVDIAHLQGSQVGESWTLYIFGLPTTSDSRQPAVRAIAALTGANSGFFGLVVQATGNVASSWCH